MKKINTLLLAGSLVLSTILIPNMDSPMAALGATTPDVTMREFAAYLETKPAHYPHSDEFIERYQQKDGGYIDLAKELGLLVDKTKHAPDQKWHFFESWMLPSINNPQATLTWESSAKDRVYNKLLCPELLLWIYEACEVSPSKIVRAKKIAEAARVAGGSLTSMAASIRSIISWEEVVDPVLKYIEDNPVGDDTPGQDTPQTYSVTYNASSAYEVIGLNETYNPGDEVTFTINLLDNTKIISSVKVNGNVITPTSNTYKFTMPKGNASILITLKNLSDDIPLSNDAIARYNIVYDLGSKTTAQPLNTTDDVLAVFELDKGEENINSISAYEYLYGGGNGGRGETAWYSSNLLKVGTTSKNGFITLELSSPVNKIKITGYAHTSSAPTIRVGDSKSNDWDETLTVDNKTTNASIKALTAVSKDAIASGDMGSLEIEFEATTSLKIATSKTTSTTVPLYLASIEFIYVK